MGKFDKLKITYNYKWHNGGKSSGYVRDNGKAATYALGAIGISFDFLSNAASVAMTLAQFIA